MHRSGVLAELTSRGYPAMALDLRGHGASPVRVRAITLTLTLTLGGNPNPVPDPNPGESPFGPPDDFGAETLARDVWDAVAAHGSSSL